MSTPYRLCVYDGASSVQLRAAAPAADLCAGQPCWQRRLRGWRYVDPERSPDGVSKMILVDGAASEARLRVRGRGSELALPAFPLTAPLRVLLRREDTGQCWDSTFSTNLAGDPLRAFRARVD